MATVAGETQFTVMSSLLAAPHVKAGKLRALATGGLTRDPKFPDVPTMAELGYPDVEAVTWVGIYAPGRTPREVVQRLNAEIARIIREPAVKAKLDQQGLVLAGGPPEELGKVISAPHPDTKNPKSSVVEMEFVSRIEPPTTLLEIKSAGLFDDWALVRQGRLSTMEAPRAFVKWMQARYPRLSL